MEFLSVANERFITTQVTKLLNARTASKDKDVIAAVKGLIETELAAQLPDRPETEQIIRQLLEVEDRTHADLFLHALKAYVIPFTYPQAEVVKKLFKKEKRLRLPKLDAYDWKSVTYLSWKDSGTHRQYFVTRQDEDWKTLQGVTQSDTVKGICRICRHHTLVNLFTATVKGKAEDAFTSYSHYICEDPAVCNANLDNEEQIFSFIEENLKRN
ncbi:FusB/FusC family EF-G-binding protein [Chryseomicrobium palamuruense]|uniref:FusB/FusC family EF-G-binding protein n=1 Tax=Chryseomicrobium palamuruense TaxID=682973 RepID=A0ABV8UX32_9BACL